MIGAVIAIATAHASALEARRIADELSRQMMARYEREYQAWTDSQVGVIELGPDDVRVVPDPKLLEQS